MILFELLTGERPFRGTSRMLVHQAIAEEAPSPRKLNAHVPRDLETICLKCLEKDPSKRYQTAEEFRNDLDRFLAGEAIAARPVSRAERLWRACKRRPAATALIGLLAITIVVAPLVVIWQVQLRNRAAQALLREARSFRDMGRNGWSRQADERLAQLPKLWGNRSQLRDGAAAFLEGVDAHRTILLRDTYPTAVAFSRDGGRLLIGGAAPNPNTHTSEPAKLWDLAQARVIAASDHAGPGPVAFTAEGRPLHALVEPGPQLLVWDVLKQQEVCTCTFPSDRVQRLELESVVNDDLSRPLVTFSPDGRRIAAVAAGDSSESRTAVWSALTGKAIQSFSMATVALALSRNGELLATADSEKRVLVWNVDDGQQVAEFPSFRSTIHCVAFSPDARLLAVGDASGTIAIWDLQSRQPISFPRGASFETYSMAFSHDAQTLASGGRVPAKLWDVATGQSLLDLYGPDFVTGIAFSPNDDELAVTDVGVYRDTGYVYLWRIDYGRGIRRLRGLATQVTKVAFSKDGRLLAALSHDWRIGVWQVANAS